MKRANTGFPKSKYLEVSKLGTAHNLSFSSQMAFGNKIIALDGIRKSLLVLEADKEVSEPYLINLNEVASVTVRKNYGSIKHGELNTKGIDEFLKTIDLQFQFKNKTPALVIPFYDREKDDKRDRAVFARNAKNWQMILSKMIEEKKSVNEGNAVLFK